MSDPLDLDRLYREGVAAIRAGDKAAGREKLAQVVERDQMHEQAWLWLSTAVDMDIERIICLENVLTINPANEIARQVLERLGVSPPPRPKEADDALSGLEPVLPDLLPDLSFLTQDIPRQVEATPSVRPIGLAAPEAVGSDLHDILAGTPGASSSSSSPPSADEAWLASLAEAEYAGPSIPEEELPSRTLGDLLLVWLQIAVLYTGHDFQDEIRRGGFGHIMMNILVAGLLQIAGGLALAIILAVLARQSVMPPLVSSMLDLVPQVGETQIIQPPAMLQPAIEGLRVLGLYDPYVGLNQIVREAQSNTSFALTWLADSLGSVALIYALAAIPLLFVSQMYYATVANMVSGWLNGRGDAFETMHALTLALVVSQFVGLPLAVVMPFVPVTVALMMLAGLRVYQLVMQTAALSTVQRFDPLASVVVLILSWGIAWGLIAGAGRVLTFLLSLTGG
jgi:hypothetical protein